MKFKIQYSRLKTVLGILPFAMGIFSLLLDGCIENVEAKTITTDSACVAGIRDAKDEIKEGKYAVYISSLPKELSPYAEEVFYVLYKKEVDVTNDAFPIMCGTMSNEERVRNRCHDKYMDSVVQSFEPGVYQRILRDAESLWRKEPGKYNSHNPQYPGQAQFPGGDTAFDSFLKTHVKYPPAAKRDSIQGVVYFQLEVDSTGKIISRSIRKGVRNDLDSSVLAALNHLPDFVPGHAKGHAATSTVLKPVRFVLK